MKIIAAALVTLGLMAGITPHADAAKPAHRQTYRVEKPARQVARLRVAYVEPMADGRAFVEFNNGAAWIVRPCPLEDSERCWWDAGHSGNGHGWSFVRLHRHTYYLHRTN